MIPYSYVHVSQLTEVVTTNSGLVVLSIIFYFKRIGNEKKQLNFIDGIRHRLLDLNLIERNLNHYRITKKESEVLELTKNGLLYKEVGDRLNMREGTAKNISRTWFGKQG